MPDLIEITDEERGYLLQLAEWEQSIYNLGYAKLAHSLATRKPVGDGEVVLRLTRAEAEACRDTATLLPVWPKLRAALDQGGTS